MGNGEPRTITMSDLSDVFSVSAATMPDNFCQSAWIEHAPFAAFLIERLRPKTFVELGTHIGYSYFSVCQTVKECRIGTSCYAVDTWQGDEHAGFYSDSVYQTVAGVNEQYKDFSSLLRMTFEEALVHFADNSVDCLHIDGRHYYEDVKQDFELWRPKLTDDAIVLFHDTDVRERQFGVWRLFDELKSDHRTFQFTHGHGLGLLAIDRIPAALEPLFDADAERTQLIRLLYARLGGHMAAIWSAREAAASARSAEEAEADRLRATKAEHERVRHDFASRERAMADRLSAGHAELALVRQDLAAKERAMAHLISATQTELDLAQQNLAAIRGSSSWRATAPLRAIIDWVKARTG